MANEKEVTLSAKDANVKVYATALLAEKLPNDYKEGQAFEVHPVMAKALIEQGKVTDKPAKA